MYQFFSKTCNKINMRYNAKNYQKLSRKNLGCTYKEALSQTLKLS